MPDAKRRQREIEDLIMAGYDARKYTEKDLDLMRAGEDLTARDARIAALEAENELVREERRHLATMLEIAAGDAWHDSFTGDPEDDYAEIWLLCLGDRADKRDARKEEGIEP